MNNSKNIKKSLITLSKSNHYFGQTGEGEVLNGTQSVSSEYRQDSDIQILGLSDSQDITILDLSQKLDETHMNEDYQSNNSLGAYLTRPKIIRRFTWTPGGNFVNTDNFVDISPWREYITDSIEDKCDSFTLMRATGLKLEFRINGSPFHYGRLYIGYHPFVTNPLPYADMQFPENLALPITNMGATLNAANFPLKTYFSQWPGVFLDPTTNAPQQLILPFMYPYNYVSLLNADSLDQMGRIKIWVLNPLQHANGATDAISIVVTASLVDPILAMPEGKGIYSGESRAGSGVPRPGKQGSRAKPRKPGIQGKPKGSKPNNRGGASVQSRKAPKLSSEDEYDESNGVLSAPANAIANFAGHLESVPFIGSFATATKIAASGVSSIAKLFGYSRPVQIKDPINCYYKPFGSLAMTSGNDNVLKLTQDPKQEITIDPVTVGLQSEDEMTLAHILKRESLLLRVLWPIDLATSQNLLHVLVHPQTVPANVGSGITRFFTALSWGSLPFLYWRGSIKYRFQIVASQMHRGRLAFVYTPSGNPQTTQPDTVSSYTEFVDITERKDFTMEIRHGSYKPWFPMSLAPGVFVGQGATSFSAPLRGQCNGCISIYVVNELASPTNLAGVEINMYVSAGDDYQVASPSSDTLRALSYTSDTLRDAYEGETYEGQSAMGGVDDIIDCEDEPQMEDDTIVLNGSENDTPDIDNMNMVFFGEQTVSLRSLLKRYCLNRVIVPRLSNATTAASWVVIHPQYPALFGYPSFNSGPMPTNETLGTPFNYVTTTYLSYFKMGFMAHRGAIRWKYLQQSTANHNLTTFFAGRRTTSTTSTDRYNVQTNSDVNGLASTYSVRTQQAMDTSREYHTMGGCGLTVEQVNGGIEFEHPWYAPMRFIWTTSPTPTGIPTTLEPDNLINDYLRHDTHVVVVRAPTATISNNSQNSSMMAFCAAGEDFSLHYFLGAPPMTLQAVPPGQGA